MIESGQNFAHVTTAELLWRAKFWPDHIIIYWAPQIFIRIGLSAHKGRNKMAIILQVTFLTFIYLNAKFFISIQILLCVFLMAQLIMSQH